MEVSHLSFKLLSLATNYVNNDVDDNSSEESAQNIQKLMAEKHALLTNYQLLEEKYNKVAKELEEFKQVPLNSTENEDNIIDNNSPHISGLEKTISDLKIKIYDYLDQKKNAEQERDKILEENEVIQGKFSEMEQEIAELKQTNSELFQQLKNSQDDLQQRESLWQTREEQSIQNESELKIELDQIREEIQNQMARLENLKNLLPERDENSGIQPDLGNDQ